MNEVLEKLLQIDPKNKEALWMQAEVFEKENKLDDLRLFFRQLYEMKILPQELSTMGRNLGSLAIGRMPAFFIPGFNKRSSKHRG